MKINATLLILSLLTTLSSFAQKNGDYRSTANGMWNSGSTWEKFNGDGWIKATVKPGSNNDVTIRSGHVVTMNEGGSASINNLIIEKGAQLNSNAIFPNSYSLRVGSAGKAGEAKNTAMLRNDGILGSVSDTTFTITLEIPLQCENFKITGSGTTQILRMRPLAGNTNLLNVEIDQNIVFMHNNVALTAYVNYPANTATERVTFTINKNKTVKFVNPGASFHLGSAKVPNLGGNYTYNIAGTLDLSETSKTSFIIPAIANPEAKVTVNITGLLKLGSGVIVESLEAGEQNGKATINILDGGIIDATLLKAKSSLPASKLQIAPTGLLKIKQ